MVRKEVKIRAAISSKNAQTLVQHCMRFKSDVMLEQATRRINGKSIMGVISLGVREGSVIMVTALGEDEVEAVNDIATLIERNFV